MQKQKAIEKLQQQIDLIGRLKHKERFSSEYKKWLRDTRLAIKHIFEGESEHVTEFKNISYCLFSSSLDFSGHEHDKAFIRGLDDASKLLESMIDEIKEYLEGDEAYDKSYNKGNILGSDIFIVHGRDHGTKESVARFIERLELRPIILHEKPNKGRTIIEKFEDHSNVGFAIVLLTNDDLGYPKEEPKKLKPRARQNVILELGFFLGKLGRDKVCALYKKGVEIPSDYEGVLFIPMDEKDWELKLAKEIKEAGIEVDLNKM